MSVLENLPHFVYHLYDADDRLLYVGCTRRFPRRLNDHMSSKPWADQIHHWTVSDPYPNQYAARLVESEAIRREGPLYNFRWSLNPHVPSLSDAELQGCVEASAQLGFPQPAKAAS